MFYTTEKHSVVIARETVTVSSMSDANIRDGYKLWLKRAGEGWCSLTMAMLNVYWNEYVARGLNNAASLTMRCSTCGASIGECDGYCTALPNELDDESENNQKRSIQ
jgi:hypothetical protein